MNNVEQRELPFIMPDVTEVWDNMTDSSLTTGVQLYKQPTDQNSKIERNQGNNS